MDRLLVIYYIRSGYVGAAARTIVDAARSAGVAARVRSPRTPYFTFRPGKGSAAINEPFFGVGAVVICPLGRGSAPYLFINSILKPGAFHAMRGMRSREAPALGGAVKELAAGAQGSMADLQPIAAGEPKIIADPRTKELLSAAIANSRACQNWLSRAKPNLERARVSIAHVIRDVNDLARLLE